MELLADEVVEVVLVAHAPVENLQCRRGGRVLPHRAGQVAHLPEGWCGTHKTERARGVRTGLLQYREGC